MEKNKYCYSINAHFKKITGTSKFENSGTIKPAVFSGAKKAGEVLEEELPAQLVVMPELK